MKKFLVSNYLEIIVVFVTTARQQYNNSNNNVHVWGTSKYSDKALPGHFTLTT